MAKVSDAKEKEIIVNFGPNAAVFERETEHESKTNFLKGSMNGLCF